MLDDANEAAAQLRPDPDAGSTLGSGYFDGLYARTEDGDPWEFNRSPYEAAKYAATLNRLPHARYASALEIGCSIGVFTRRLADRVDHLLAIDVARAALDQAKARCQDQRHVRFELADPLDAVPPGPFDLIVLAEVAYYWTRPDFLRVFPQLLAELGPGGQILLVHWRDLVPDYPQTGDQVHYHAEELADRAGLAHQGGWIEPRYRTDLWERPDHS